MKLQTLLAGIVEHVPEIEITHISSHSQQLSAGSLWLATQGAHGHALDHKPICQPAAIVYEPPYANPPAGAIAVENLSARMSEIAARFYEEPSKALCVVGVTGTDGKSSLVHLLSQALSGAMIGTIGYGTLDRLQPASHTTPEAVVVQNLLAKYRDLGVEHVAMEVSSHALHQHRVAAVNFSVGVFTNLSRDHLDYHKDMEDYFLTKALLFAKPLQAAVVNIDDKCGRRLVGEQRIHAESALFTVGLEAKEAPIPAATHITAHNITFNSDGLRFDLCIKREGQEVSASVQSALLARFNLCNLLNVAAVLSALGWDIQRVARALSALEPVRGRAQSLLLKNQATAVIDYAHTPAALENILQGMRPHLAWGGKLYCVFGCGGDRDKGKRPLMAAAAKRFADVAIITDDNPRREDPEAIVQDMLRGAPDVQVVRPRSAAIAWAYQRLRAGDMLVIAGKGHEEYQIIGNTKHYYNDVEIVQALEQPYAQGLTARQVAQICGGEVRGDGQTVMEYFTTDSRQRQAGSCFIALRGKRFDGARFVPTAVQAGAVAVMVEQPMDDVTVAQVVVSDTRQALWTLAQFYRARARDKQFVAITGSNGKTSTKEILASILRHYSTNEVLATQGNLNNDLGVPLTLLNLNDKQKYAVIEMGANHQGEIKALVELVEPDVALVTNVAPAHLAGFGSVEGVLAAKSEMYEYSHKCLVLNKDSLGFEDWAECYAERKPYIFGRQAPADVHYRVLSEDGSHFKLLFDTSKRFNVRWQLAGEHQVANAAAACACALALGVPPQRMMAGLRNLRLEHSRLTPYRLGKHWLFDDSYNANPASFKAAIDVLSALPAQKIVFAGAMAELGEDSDALHEEVATYAKNHGIAEFHFMLHPEVHAQAYKNGFPRAIAHADYETAYSALLTYLSRDEPVAILVKGSRSAAMERLLSFLTLG